MAGSMSGPRWTFVKPLSEMDLPEDERRTTFRALDARLDRREEAARWVRERKGGRS